jgi:TP901 family phage tail tape measure protein
LVDRATGPAGKAVRKLEQMSGRVGRAGLKSLEISDRMGEFNKRRNAELRGQTVAMAGLAATVYAGLRPAIQFEKQMSKVGAAGQMSKEETAGLSQEALRLGAASAGWTARQVGEGMEYLALAGLDANKIIAAMPGLLNLASAAQTDLASSSDYASDIMSAFKKEAEQMGQIGDVLTNTFTSSNQKLPQLSAALLEAAPSANQLGVSLEITAGMAGKLADNGIKGSKAGTAMRAIFARLAAPTSAARKELKKLNIEVADQDGNMRDFPTILADMEKSMADMGDVAKAEVLNTVFGLEAVNAASILMGSAGSGALQTYIATLNDAGSAARVAAEINDNTEGSLKRLGSSAEKVSIVIGTLLIPMVADLAESLIPVLTHISDWAAANPELVKTIGEWAGKLFIAAGALLAMKWAFSPVLSAVRAGIWVWGATSIGIGLVGVALRALVGLATKHPLLILVTALAAGALLIYENWDGIVGYFENVIDKIKAMFAGLVFWDGPVARPGRGGRPEFNPRGAAGRSPNPAQGAGAEFNPRNRYRDPYARKRALGGGVRAGFAYEINERGQELFVPSTSGSVINARASSGRGAAAGQTSSISVGDINIYPPAGASPEEIGQIVMRKFEELMDNGAALHDGGAL